MMQLSDPRRRRALFRSWHRGMRETDLLMGRFADAEIANLSEADLDRLRGASGGAGPRHSHLVDGGGRNPVEL